MIKRARDFTGPPAPVRAAATVVLLRPQGHTFQAYVLRRASTMAFGGVYAFPGGGVDDTDRPELVNQDWPARVGRAGSRAVAGASAVPGASAGGSAVPGASAGGSAVPGASAGGIAVVGASAVVGAAARELFEEAGVLLAGRKEEPDHTVGDVSGPEWEADRAAVAARQLTMTDLLARHGLRLRDDLLFPWARWITPEFEPKRYDTWFFVAVLPAAQTARDVSGEADRTAWVNPAAADELLMLPPTRSMLDDLSAYDKIEDVVTASRSRDAAAPVMPRVEQTDAGVLLVID
jgi:8-oxo-dGTP pyrophosphatase MutT (NUDIX family)